MSKSSGPDSISDEEILAALDRSGFLIEARARRVLEENDFFVLSNSTFPYPSTGTLREIDLYAQRSLSIGQDERHDFSAKLIIECKNNPNPIVFLTHSMYPQLGIAGLHLSGHPLTVYHGTERQAHIKYALDFGFHHYSQGSVSTQFCSFQRKKSGAKKDEWMAFSGAEEFGDFQKLCAAVDYFDDEESHKSITTRPHDVTLCAFWPVVIVRGDLRTLSPCDSEPKLIDVQHVKYEYQTINQRGRQHYQIDVVCESYFPEFLRLVNSETQQFLHRLEEHLDLLSSTAQTMFDPPRPVTKG